MRAWRAVFRFNCDVAPRPLLSGMLSAVIKASLLPMFLLSTPQSQPTPEAATTPSTDLEDFKIGYTTSHANQEHPQRSKPPHNKLTIGVYALFTSSNLPWLRPLLKKQKPLCLPTLTLRVGRPFCVLQRSSNVQKSMHAKRNCAPCAKPSVPAYGRASSDA